MSEEPVDRESFPPTDDAADDDRTFERLGGVAVLVSLLLMAALAAIGHYLFWVPFAVGFGVVLPALAYLADRRRGR